MEMKFSVRMKALFGQDWHGNEAFCPNEGSIRTELAWK
jgi:hypothetical protein